MQPKVIPKTPICSICKEKGHRANNKNFHQPKDKLEKPRKLQEPISDKEYQTTVEQITTVLPEVIKKSLVSLKVIQKDEHDDDSRNHSAALEKPFLDLLKHHLGKMYPSMSVDVQKSRKSADVLINGLWINLKISSLGTDNSCSKSGIFFSYTACPDFPCGVNWNDFKKRMDKAKAEGKIKKTRQKSTEYHYLVVDKASGKFIFKSIFDIHTYKPNPSNDLQINWANEFKNRGYVCDDYPKKKSELYKILQLSQKKSIETKDKFAYEEFDFVSV